MRAKATEFTPDTIQNTQTRTNLEKIVSQFGLLDESEASLILNKNNVLHWALAHSVERWATEFVKYIL